MNLKVFKMLATGIVSMLLNVAIAQQNITISGNDIHDAAIHNNTRPGYEYSVTANYGSHPRIAAMAWTNSGYNSYLRTLLSFNLSAIPSGSVIQSATYIYAPYFPFDHAALATRLKQFLRFIVFKDV